VITAGYKIVLSAGRKTYEYNGKAPDATARVKHKPRYPQCYANKSGDDDLSPLLFHCLLLQRQAVI